MVVGMFVGRFHLMSCTCTLSIASIWLARGSTRTHCYFTCRLPPHPHGVTVVRHAPLCRCSPLGAGEVASRDPCTGARRSPLGNLLAVAKRRHSRRDRVGNWLGSP
jgi:hypothetical protein